MNYLKCPKCKGELMDREYEIPNTEPLEGGTLAWCEACKTGYPIGEVSESVKHLPTIDRTRKILADAISTFGETAQLDMVIEECAELIKAVAKYKRNGAMGYEGLLDETADVHIMLFQLDIMLGSEKVGEKTAYKLNRLEDRIRMHNDPNYLPF